MSESTNINCDLPRWRSQALDDVYSSDSSSGEVFQPTLRRRHTTSRISPTQVPTNTDHDYVMEPESAVQVENRSVDVIPTGELEEEGEEEDDEEASDNNDNSDNAESSLSPEVSMRNSDQADTEQMITMPLQHIIISAVYTPALYTSPLAEAESGVAESESAVLLDVGERPEIDEPMYADERPEIVEPISAGEPPEIDRSSYVGEWLRLMQEDVERYIAEQMDETIDTQMDPQEELPAPSTSALAVAESQDVDSEIGELATPSPPSKKRKRTSLTGGSEGAQEGTPTEEEDDGLTCPICLDSWEVSGAHRLVSLRCGHLFGDSCIRRWMTESFSQTAMCSCPQCKANASPRDIRYLYAKRVRAIDRTEQHDLRKAVSSLQTDLASIKMLNAFSLAKMKREIEKLECEMKKLHETLLSLQ